MTTWKLNKNLNTKLSNYNNTVTDNWHTNAKPQKNVRKTPSFFTSCRPRSCRHQWIATWRISTVIDWYWCWPTGWWHYHNGLCSRLSIHWSIHWRRVHHSLYRRRWHMLQHMSSIWTITQSQKKMPHLSQA